VPPPLTLALARSLSRSLRRYENTIAKLVGVFEVFDRYARGKMTLNNCHAPFVLVNGSDDENHETKMHYRHSFHMFLRDEVVAQNKGTTLDLDADGVEFAKVTPRMFEDALRKCPKICEVFGAQLTRVAEKSGVREGEGA
jgi:hypothetical protein